MGLHEKEGVVVIGGLIAAGVFVMYVAWVAFSFWLGGIIGMDRYNNAGVAALIALTLVFLPVVFFIGILIGG